MSSKPVLKLDWCSHEAAKYAVEKWHYSKRMPRNKTVKVGCWENGSFIGVVIFGCGASSDLGTRFGLSAQGACELARIALTSHATPVTRIVRVAIKFLVKVCPEIELVVSFADPEQNHHGGIYQGGNWIYAGTTSPSDEYLVGGRWMHGRAVRKTMERHSIPGSNTLERVRSFYDPDAIMRKGTSKHRYLMPISLRVKQQCNQLAQPYPKRAVSVAGDTSANHAEEGGSIPTTALLSGRKVEKVK